MPPRSTDKAAELQALTLQSYKRLYASIKGGFVLPPDYPGHTHAWVALDAGLNICSLCGAEHICFQGTCQAVEMEHSEEVCSISGCVIRVSALKPEWNSVERVCSPSASTTPGLKKGQSLALIARRTNTIHDTVTSVVREILDSPKTAQCLAEEQERDHARRLACLAKVIREMGHEQEGGTLHRPNMLEMEAKISFQCRKCRVSAPRGKPHVFLGIKRRVIRVCIDNICSLLQNHGGQRVERQLQNASRGRELICSLLYLMRSGVCMRNQTVLQKMEVLNDMLPLQSFLPTVFQIRSKSICEGTPLLSSAACRR